MSQLNSRNFYEVLGVEKAADERTIKKAYFALVRKYPPESHPEEFKKIREAYEVLSDGESRKQYDSMGEADQHGAEVSERVREAMEAMDQERYADAQAILTALLESRPDLHFVRDLLGISHLRNKDPVAALAIFESLVGSNPENAAYQLHKAYAHHALKQYPQAEAGYREAKRLDPDDVRPLVSLGDCYMDQRRWDDAVRALDEAINQDGAVDFRDFALFLRKLEIEIERRNPQQMAAVLNQLMTIIPEDPAARRVVANRLASFAAPLFAQKRVDEANLLMKECAKLDPNRGTGRMPTSFDVAIERLPEASKQWLITQNKTKSFGKVNGSPYALAIFLLLVGVGGALVPAAVLFTDERGLDAGQLLMFGLIFAAGLLLIAWSVLRLMAVAKSPYGSYTMVHPLYLLHVKVDHVTAWPLANLHDVKVTHRHTNGIYNGSGIDLVFQKRTYSTTIYGKDASVQWANHVLSLRRRMLELMYSGMLEDTSDDTKLIPANLIPEEGTKAAPTEQQAALSKRNRKVYLASAGAAAAVTLVAIPVNAANVDHREFRDAQFAWHDKIGALKGYVAQHPKGRHVEEAKQAIDKLYDQAVTRANRNADAELHQALVDIITTLKATQDTRITVRYASKARFDKLDLAKLPPDLAKAVVNPKEAFSPDANLARERLVTSSLEKAFDEALGDGLVTFQSSGEAPVTFTVNYEVGLTGSIYESVKATPGHDHKFFGIAFSWDFDVAFAADHDQPPRYSFSVDSQPAKDIRWTSYGSGGAANTASPTLPYDKMAESAFDDFKEQLAYRFGVASAHPREPLEEPGEEDEDVPPKPPPPKKAPLPAKKPVPTKR